MKKEIDAREIAHVAAALMTSDCKSAVKYLDDKTIVRATWHNKPTGRARKETMVVTIGAPNYREVKFINRLKKANEPFPVKKIQLKSYPVKAA